MDLVRFSLRKLLHLVAVAFLVTLAVTGLLSLIPGSAAAIILGAGARPEQVDRLNEQLGLTRPFLERYGDWVSGVLRGDFGSSLLTRAPVTDLIATGLSVTLQLVLMGLGMALLVAIPLAAYTARHPGGRLDTAANAVASALMSVPTFVLGLGLLFVFAVQIPMLPVGGWVPFTQDPWGNLQSAFLPALVLAAHPMAQFFRVLRTDMITTLQQDFVLTARSKGLPTRYVLMRHALRPSLTTLVTLAGLALGALISGAVIAEVIFRLPGLGSMTVSAVTNRDIPVVQGMVTVIAITYVLINAFVDILQALIDPRVRTS